MALGIKIPKDAFVKGREAHAKGPNFNNIELEPGQYICQLINARGVDTANGPSVVLDLTVAGETAQAGGRISIFFSLEEERIVWLFSVLALLEYEVKDLDEAMLEEIMTDIETTKPIVRVKATRTGEYINYRINKLLKDVTLADTESAIDTAAAGGKAGIKTDSPPAKAAATKAAVAAPTPVVKRGPGRPKKVETPPPTDPPPTAEDGEEVVAPAAPAQEEEASTELKVDMKVLATLKAGPTIVTITAIHPEEVDKDGNVGKVTARKEDGTLVKIGISKITEQVA